MCRIVGFLSQKPIANQKQVIQSMLDSVAHGGPDDEGLFSDELVALGHRRLSIIDLSAEGHQPMFLHNELIITYNGEIYNYQELTNELKKLGAVFKTQSDTEVILMAYQYWGVKAFDRFEGIFAFALYDKKHSKVLLVRDQLGVKPLYYFADGSHVVFGSEVRVFTKFREDWEENEKWKILFLAFGSIPFPYTTLKDVFQVRPGCYVEIEIGGLTTKTESYILPRKKRLVKSQHDAVREVGNGVRAAVKKNLIADAPLGVFLSGGIDSSIITLLAEEQKPGLKTLSINFEEAQFDERPFQAMILERAKNVDHTSFRVNERMFWETLPEIWKAMDQPTIDGVHSYFISKCARENGLKAVLSGLGADEIFGGYASFKRIKLLNYLRNYVPFKRLLSKIIGFRKHAYRRLMYLKLKGPVGDYLFLRGIHTPDIINRILNVPESYVWQVLKDVEVDIPSGIHDYEYASALESMVYMRNQLLKDTDCMSMWHGLEVRVPFLDVELMRTLADIDPAEKYKNQTHKSLLISALPGLLPNDVVDREKKGFTFPIQLWIKNNHMRFRNLVTRNKMSERVIDGFMKGYDHWSKCWSLAVLCQFENSKFKGRSKDSIG